MFCCHGNYSGELHMCAKFNCFMHCIVKHSCGLEHVFIALAFLPTCKVVMATVVAGCILYVCAEYHG